MRLPDNIEKSAFRRGEYVGYDPKGSPWRVRKSGTGGWEATPAPSHPGMFCVSRVVGRTLSDVAHSLAQRKPAAVVEPW